jgi:4-hydroxy-3-polyprenylbenzoate decarboxylase
LHKQRIIVGISGATGIVYAIRLLEALRSLGIETHLSVSQAADITRVHETDLTAKQLRGLADVTYRVQDIGAPISSGSFHTFGMIVAPCSVNSMSEIANGITRNLLTRAADVVLKERRRLVLLVRKSPLTLTHIRNILAITECGGIIAPPVPTFYGRPKEIRDIVDHTVGRMLDLFGIDTGGFRRWGENAGEQGSESKASTGGLECDV